METPEKREGESGVKKTKGLIISRNKEAPGALIRTDEQKSSKQNLKQRQTIDILQVRCCNLERHEGCDLQLDSRRSKEARQPNEIAREG